MLKRYRARKTGPFDELELKDIYRVSQFLHYKYSLNDKKLSPLEKDYIKYCKEVFWQSTKYTSLFACMTFITVDMFYPINRLTFFPRLGFKIASSYFIFKIGFDEAYKSILDFPLMNEVIGETIIKHTEWIDIASNT